MGIFSSILGTVGSFFGFGGGSSGTSFWGDLWNGIKAFFGIDSNSTSSLLGDFAGLLQDFNNSAIGGILSLVNNVSGELDTTVNNISNALSDFVNPIKNTIDSVTKLAQDIQDKLVGPITSTITTSYDQINSLFSSLHTDLAQGLQGIVKIPGQIASALTSVDAQWNRATQEMGTQNAKIAEGILVPGMQSAIGDPLGNINTVIAEHLAYSKENPIFAPDLKIYNTKAVDQLIEDNQSYIDSLSNPKGLWQNFVASLLNADRAVSGLSAGSEYWLDVVRQNTYAQAPTRILGPSELIEGWRRGVIDPASAQLELLKNGIDQSRQQILYDIAQFLFGPRESVDLFFRGIISETQLSTLLQQNNLSSDQADALIQLASYKFEPGAVAELLARGLITEAQALSLYYASGISSDQADIINTLEREIADPRLLLELQGRQGALGNGFLRNSLGSIPPDVVLEQYDKAQVERTQAELDWLRHWAIPGAEWWIRAYFRGMRTQEELYARFQAENIPQELWDDMVAEREELPPVWLVPDIVGAGVWGADKAIPQLMKLGFSEENATVLYNYGLTKTKASKAQTADGLQKLSLGVSKKLFDDGIITAQQYEQVLIDHKYEAPAAKLTVELAQIELNLTNRKNFAEDLIAQANLGMITELDVQDQLMARNYTATELYKYLKAIKVKKLAATKWPTEAQLNKLAKDGLIGEDQWLQYMGLLGYNAEVSALLWKIA